MQFIPIDEEMRAAAKVEAARRDPHITHHFEVPHLTYEQRDEVGFCGEFACCKYLGIDWKSNIRKNYFTVDDCDLIYKGKKIDIKTETVPKVYAEKILAGNIIDDHLYGRRLISEKQFAALHKYNLVIFGMLIREGLDKWFPIGFLNTDNILQNYKPSIIRPDGGRYRTPAAPVKTSVLKPITQL